MTPRPVRFASALALAGLGIALAACVLASPAPEGRARDGRHLFDRPGFDLEAHRGGTGLVVENTLDSFANALALGVSTLELDTQITRDGVAMVGHDRRLSALKCRDTGPATAGDPLYPYVGRLIKDLTLAQLRTLDCGSLRQAAHPGQELRPGARMPTLAEVLELVNARQAHRVMLNIETKVEAGAPDETAPRERFVQAVVGEIRRAGLVDQATIESFDWGALRRVRRIEPRLPLIALTNGPRFLQPGQPGASPWLGGLDIDDFDGDVVAAAASLGVDALSPVHGDPEHGHYGDPGYVPYVTAGMVRRAHAAGLKIIPWTVDDDATFEYLLDLGVDGLITDRPDRLRAALERRGLAVAGGEGEACTGACLRASPPARSP